MVKYRDQKQKKDKFSRFATLSLFGWLCIVITSCIVLFYYHYGLNFKTSFTQANSYLILYQQRSLILIGSAIFIALFLLIIYIRLSALRFHSILKLPLYFIPIIFLASLIWLSFSIYTVVQAMDIPLGKGIFLIKAYLQSFTIDLIWINIQGLPYQLNSIKYPFYGLLYSYFAMFSVMILLPFHWAFKAHTIWRKFNLFIVFIFLALFFTSAYYLTNIFILHDPFLQYEQMMNH